MASAREVAERKPRVPRLQLVRDVAARSERLDVRSMWAWMDPPAIAGVRPTMHMTVVGQAVDDRGEGAGSDEHALGQFAGH
jgi:hypothetical protein